MMRKLPQANPCAVPAACASRLRSRALKSILWISLALVLLPAATRPQALPDNLAPAPFDPRWNHIEQISDGQRITVRTTSGTKVRCRFAGATDACLFCDPPGPQRNQAGYRFDRASVVSVMESRPASDLHPGLLVAMAIVGAAFGIASTRNNDDRGAAAIGLISAGMVGAIGFEAIQMRGEDAGFGSVYRPGAFGFAASRLRGPRIRIRIPIGHPR
jgi:hypothetical protein